ncbi:MAG: alpha/beta hydrolase, partial [Shimia sp.]|nr:alpha/beta hydrolase [Shimia sp.]
MRDCPAVADSKPTQHGTMRLRDGRKLAYRCFGPEDGNPCLFIHNMLSGPAMLLPLMPHLEARGVRLICPVRPGFGESDVDEVCRDDPSQAPTRFARDAMDLLDHLGESRV